MYFVIIVISAFFALIAYLVERNLYNPVFLLCCEWTMLMLLHSMNLTGLLPASVKALCIVLIGIVMFTVGCTVVKIISKQRLVKINRNKDMRLNEGEIKKVILYALVGIAIIVLLSMAGTALYYLRRGYSFWSIRYVLAGEILQTSFISRLNVYVVKPIGYVIIPIAIYRTFLKMRDGKILLLLSLVIVFLQAVSTGGRLIVLYFICSFVIFYYIMKDKIRMSRKMKFGLIIAVAVVILLMILLSIIRETSFTKSLYDYAVTSITFLSIKLEQFESNYKPCNGMFSWYGITNPISKIIEALFGGDFSQNVNRLLEFLDKPVIVDSNRGIFNYFATAFFRFYADFKYVGVGIFSFLWGCISMHYYQNFQRSQCIRNIIMYNLIIYGIIISVMTFLFSDVAIVTAIVFIYIITQSDKHRFNITFGKGHENE